MSPTLDEYTGDVFPATLVAAAKEEDEVVAAMDGVWDVWDVVTVAESWRATGRKRGTEPHAFTRAVWASQSRDSASAATRQSV